MDVCCEKCSTEYELNESKLKPGGVTVKCTTCGHMFKVRRARASTSVGHGPPRVPTFDPERARSPTPSMIEQDEHAAERTWLIRLGDGEIKTCQELATLQKWIVAGTVTRDCEISRTAKKWKRLGEIGELVSFFEIADEARSAIARERTASAAPRHVPATGSHPHVIRRPPTSAPPPVPRPSGTPKGEPERATLRPASDSNAVDPHDEITSPSALVGIVADDDDGPTVGRAERESTGRWAVAGTIRPSTESGGHGPTAGAAVAGGGGDVAFVSSRSGRPSYDTEQSFVPADTLDPTDAGIEIPRSGAGRWIIAISILIMAGAAAAVYLVAFRDDSKDTSGAVDVADAGVVGASDSIDAATGPVVAPATGDARTLVESASNVLRADSQSGLELVAGKMATLEVGDQEWSFHSTRALVESALAQHEADAAAVAGSAADKRQHGSNAKKRAKAALEIADRVLASEPNNTDAMIAKSHALRINGARAREIDRWLKRALRQQPKSVEALYSKALVRLRDNRRREARSLLSDLDGLADGDVRPRYRLALLDFDDKAFEKSAANVDSVLAAQPEHAGALTLRERIKTAVAVDTSDPVPPEAPPKDVKTPDDRPPPGESPLDTYDRLLERADGMAENGDCRGAVTIYKRALDIHPSGVAGLTGLGYCHLDAKQFASAHAKFRAALGISSRYQDALWGVAEAYQQQGLARQAIESYRRFLSHHPGSRRAIMAKRQIERLGGSVGGDDDGGEDSGNGDGDSGGNADGPGDTTPDEETPDPSAESPAVEPAATGGTPAPTDSTGSEDTDLGD